MSTFLPTTFSDASLQKAINRAAANFDHDDNAVLVAHVDDQDGASLSLAIRVNDEWKLQGVVVKEWDKPFRFGADIVWHGKLW